MKATIIFLTIVCASRLAAQDWSPILVNEKMNYQHTDSVYISHTIWVESVQYSGNDTIYQLNRIVKDVPGNPEIALRNQPQFLLKQMKKQDAGVYTFNDPGGFTIHALGANSETWLFDQDNNIIAQVTSLSLEDVFGVQDSVKVIILSDGNEIRLSKNFGILKFPDFENGGNYLLVGIQNTAYGESVPDFWDIFDFEVGDVFQYKYHDLYAGSGYVNDFTIKYTISTKTISGNTIEYETEGIEAGNFQYLYPPWDGYSYAYFVTYELEYFDSSNYSVNKFNDELIKMWNITVCPMGTGEIFTRYSVYADSNDVPSKHFGLYIGEFDGNLYYTNNYLSDELIAIPNPLMACDEGGFAGMTYKKS
jgi:hypothetical protein